MSEQHEVVGYHNLSKSKSLSLYCEQECQTLNEQAQELADLRAKLAEAETQLAGVKDDLRASTEQHIMDDDIIVGLRAKLAEAERKLDVQLKVMDKALHAQYERAEQAEAREAALREVLSQWKCSECRGRGEYDYRRSDDKYSIQRCRQCEGTGINPVARAALATANKAVARYAAMQRVCEVAEDERRIEYPKALIEALDELAKLDN